MNQPSPYSQPPVECRWSVDQAAGVARLVRQDTGEVVRERALQASERQVKLFAIALSR